MSSRPTHKTFPLPSQSRTWLITGCSSGFGRMLAETVLAAGERTVVTARNLDAVRDFEQRYPEQAYAAELDVTDPATRTRSVEAALARFGRLDVLVNNAGYGLLGAIEELTEEELRRQFETNVFGLIGMTQAVLPVMRQSRAGHILNVSSMAGFIGRAGLGAYDASKFAVEGFSEALADEVGPLGIRVTIIEPGAFRTAFGGRSLQEAEKVIAEYATTAGRARAGMRESHGLQPGDPARAAQAILDVVNSEHPPLRLVLGSDALQRIRQKLEAVAQELAEWEVTTRSTDYLPEAA